MVTVKDLLTIIAKNLRYMKWMQEQNRYENLTYLALWGMLFTVPVLSLYIRTMEDASYAFSWNEVFMIWGRLGIYLIIFLLHNFLLAPLLVFKQKRAVYFSCLAAIVGIFVAFQCSHRPKERPDHPRERMEMADRMERMERMDGPHDRQQPPRHIDRKPPVMFGEHDIVAIIVMILMLGMNLGIKFYYKSRHDSKQLMILEKENLQQQLEYLRYQINPHFFMNTLNNIHALVDIDPEKAKDTIVELSKMMRFILYEGDKKGVPLCREFDFIKQYLTLMRLRYPEKVDMRFELPATVPDSEIPPLMLITFVENAFKHGISYQQESFVHINARIKNKRLHFECSNSKCIRPNQEKGGVGLANIKKRLDLIYGNNYTLNLEDKPSTYHVELEIPLS